MSKPQYKHQQLTQILTEQIVGLQKWIAALAAKVDDTCTYIKAKQSFVVLDQKLKPTPLFS